MNTRIANLLLSLLVTAVISITSPARAATAVYVANGGSKDISVFHLDAASGALTARGTTALEGAPPLTSCESPILLKSGGCEVHSVCPIRSPVRQVNRRVPSVCPFHQVKNCVRKVFISAPCPA